MKIHIGDADVVGKRLCELLEVCLVVYNEDEVFSVLACLRKEERFMFRTGEDKNVHLCQSLESSDLPTNDQIAKNINSPTVIAMIKLSIFYLSVSFLSKSFLSSSASCVLVYQSIVLWSPSSKKCLGLHPRAFSFVASATRLRGPTGLSFR